MGGGGAPDTPAACRLLTGRGRERGFVVSVLTAYNGGAGG